MLGCDQKIANESRNVGEVCQESIQCKGSLLCVNNICSQRQHIETADEFHHGSLHKGEQCQNTIECEGALFCVNNTCSEHDNQKISSNKNNETQLYGERYSRGDSICQMGRDEYGNAWEFCMDIHSHCMRACPNGNSNSWLCAYHCN